MPKIQRSWITVMKQVLKKVNYAFLWVLLLPISYIAWSMIKTVRGVKKLNKK